MRDFRQLRVWQAAHGLALEIYKVTRAFPKTETYGLTAQLRRAAASAPTNIAEGSARQSDRSTRYFLEIALGSATEVEYLLLLAMDLGILDEAPGRTLTAQTSTVRRMLNAFIRQLKLGPTRPPR